jgi:hypothetical protein
VLKRLLYIVKYCRVFIIECIIRNKRYERNRALKDRPFAYPDYDDTCAAHCVIFRPMKVLSVCMFDESGEITQCV